MYSKYRGSQTPKNSIAKQAHFGFRTVAEEQKQPLVQEVFSQVANHYDLMNDLMSFGLHRLWKRRLIAELPSDCDMELLDVAGGTGDIARQFIDSGGAYATVCDLNQEMLNAGQKRLYNQDCAKYMKWVQGNAQQLPFADNSYDYYSISFGIRNVTNIEQALSEAHRVIKRGGKFVCLEFSNVSYASLARLYELYSFRIIPKIGGLIAGNRDAYQYLVESIRQFPKAPAFAAMIEDAGFVDVRYTKLTFGIVAIHIGYKYH